MIETVSGPTLPDPDAITTREELAAALTILRQHANLSIRDLVAASGVLHGTV